LRSNSCPNAQPRRALHRALQFNRERMAEAAQSGYLNAMAAATYLVHKGVPFRTAHEKIGNAVRFALTKASNSAISPQ
jgi:argininosuccinate lyase